MKILNQSHPHKQMSGLKLHEIIVVSLVNFPEMRTSTGGQPNDSLFYFVNNGAPRCYLTRMLALIPKAEGYINIYQSILIMHSCA